MPITIEIIRMKFKEQRPKTSDYIADTDFFNFLFAAFQIAQKSLKHQFDFKVIENSKEKLPPFKGIIGCNFVVNCVTALEVYFKRVILEDNEWDDGGLNQLLSPKLSLGEAYDMFRKERLTREYVISHYYSFQNMESIVSTFSKLIGEDFFKAIEIHHVKEDDNTTTTLLEEYPDWRSSLSQVFDIRNKFVHDGIIERVTPDDLEGLCDFVLTFQYNVSDFLHHRYIRIIKEATGRAAKP